MIPSQERKSKLNKDSRVSLPVIPNKRYFTIGEVGDLCAVKPHVLRYWEQEFPKLKPVKRRGNRRYYQVDDVIMIRQIRKLLYEDGFTIEGARLKLADKSSVDKSVHTDDILKKMILELENILQKLKMDNVFFK